MKKHTKELPHQPKRLLLFTINNMFFVKPFLLFIFLFTADNLLAQKDAILKKDSTEIRCKILKATGKNYTYAFIDKNNNVSKATVSKALVNAVQYNKYDSNLIAHKLFDKKTPEAEEEAPLKPYQFTFGIGLNVGNILEFNSPSGPDKKSFSATSAIDLGLNYYKESSRFAMTNELHWTISVQKSGLTSAAFIQRVTDDLSTLHDFSFAINKSNKWNFNLIAKSNTSVFTIFNGDYFKDYNNLGKIQGFLNPYEVTLSPGIKYQPNDYFRFSLSPYSVNLYGLLSQQIANTGFYTQTFDVNNNYDLFVFKQLGAELNIWYDRKFKKWLEMQYRLGISSDYFSKIAKNGLLDGLFITKIRLIKNVYLTHRAILKGDFTQKPFKPYYNQTVLLSFAKSF
jgi:hypothetical protein